MQGKTQLDSQDPDRREKPVDLKGTFDSESDACLQALQDLFLTRVNANRERRVKQNSSHPMVSGVSRIVWLTRIFVYVSLDDC